MQSLNLVPEAAAALAGGAALAISVSGGKDSQAMLEALVAEHRTQKWPGEVFAIHSDLGRAEWAESQPHCQQQCDRLGIQLAVVRRLKGDMVDRWQERMHKLAGTGKPFWSSSSQRYCTSDMKRGPIDTYLRRYKNVVCAIGIRSQESRGRARQLVWQHRTQICTKDRQAYSWNAIFDWKIEDVWETIGTTSVDLERRRWLYREGSHKEALEGWPGHPAYVYGNERVSCALCVLASRADLRIGALHNPQLFRILTDMEGESGWSFRHNDALVHLFDAKPKGLARVPPDALPLLGVQQELDFTCSC